MLDRVNGEVDVQIGPPKVMRARSFDGRDLSDRGVSKSRKTLEGHEDLAAIEQQRHLGFQPERGLAIRVLHMDMCARFLAAEEEARGALLDAHDVHLDDLAALDADVVRQDQVSRR